MSDGGSRQSSPSRMLMLHLEDLFYLALGFPFSTSISYFIHPSNSFRPILQKGARKKNHGIGEIDGRAFTAAERSISCIHPAYVMSGSL